MEELPKMMTIGGNGISTKVSFGQFQMDHVKLTGNIDRF
jgi:hypothetical protein